MKRTLQKASIAFFLGLILGFPQTSFARVEFKPGASLRVRHEFWKNISDQENDAKDNRNYFRIRYSFDGTLSFNEKIIAYTRLTDEFKAYTYFYQSTNRKKGINFDIDETVFDNLYLDVKDVLGAPVDIRLGRQDFMGTYGEGFLIYDGTPGDGSRTHYFNAFKTSWRMTPANQLDFIYINDPRYDSFLPIINENDPSRTLNATSEEAYVLDWQNKKIKNLTFEGYYIYKKEDDKGGVRLQSQKSRINTPGFFTKYQFDPFAVRGQLACQKGNYGLHGREALGGYVFLDRDFKKISWAPQASVGFIYLSGDDPSTGKNEGWDPLFSRQPWMSELYSLSYNSESGTNYWTNLRMWRGELTWKIGSKIKPTVRYNFLQANDNPASAGFALGSGKNRGQLPQVKVDYAFTKDITAYILAEYFIPGNFYADSADESLFVRTELKIKF